MKVYMSEQKGAGEIKGWRDNGNGF